ncbi:MAG: tripartite tricarboxylate transporter substrate binding protein [Pseudomonadota bacterium]
MKKTLIPQLAAIALIAACSMAQAQTTPTKIQILVPFSPGGPIDFSARVLADKLRTQLSIPVVVENRPGGNGVIAALAVKQALGNGETLLMASSGMLTISPHLDKNLKYDPIKDFAAVSAVAYSDVAFVVNPVVPVNSLKEFVANAKTIKPQYSIGSAGKGNITHGYIELFKDSAKIDLLHVPYKGASLALSDVLGGTINGTFVGLSAAIPHIKSGKLKALGLVGNDRSVAMPEIPTFTEQGYKGVDFITWSGLLAPKSTSKETLAFLQKAIATALAQDDVKARLITGGSAPYVVAGDAFEKAIIVESAKWAKLIKEKNIEGE